jgi:hypothetical protein
LFAAFPSNHFTPFVGNRQESFPNLISNYHVVKDATKVRLLTSAGLIDAKVVQVDAANDLALLKVDGRFACLPIAASRTGLLGGTVATVGFPDIGLQKFFNHETHELHEKLKTGEFGTRGLIPPRFRVFCVFRGLNLFPGFWPRGKSRRCPARG